MAKKGSSLSSTKPWVKTIYLIILILAMLVSVFPLIYMVVLSFMNTTSMKLTLERVFTASYTLKNYVKLFKQVDFLAFFRNSAIRTAYSVPWLPMDSQKRDFLGKTASSWDSLPR